MKMVNCLPRRLRIIRAASAAALLAVGLTAAPAFTSAQSILNGSFEAPVASNVTDGGGDYWTALGNAYLIPNTAGFGNTPYGDQFLGLDAGASDAQTIDQVVVGTTYELSLACTNFLLRKLDNLTITLSGAVSTSSTYVLPYIGGAYALSESVLTLDFTPATTGPLTITLIAVANNQTNEGALVIDNVVLSGGAVPEPSAWWLLLGGFGLLLSRTRLPRKRRL